MKWVKIMRREKRVEKNNECELINDVNALVVFVVS